MGSPSFLIVYAFCVCTVQAALCFVLLCPDRGVSTVYFGLLLILIKRRDIPATSPSVHI